MQDKQTRWIQAVLTVCILMLVNTGIVLAAPTFRLVYVVQEGDNLTSVAKEFSFDVYHIKKLNGLTDRSVLKAGHEILLPKKNEPLPEQVQFKAKLFSDRDAKPRLLGDQNYLVRVKHDFMKVNIPKDQIITYHVKRGDTLSALAKQFGTTVAVIRSLNKMEVTNLRQGQALLMPTTWLPKKLEKPVIAKPAMASLKPYVSSDAVVLQKQKLARSLSAEDFDLLARVVQAEAGGESYIGRVAVAAVILNRAVSGRFANTIHGVLHQPGQFDTLIRAKSRYKPSASTVKAVREALDGSDPSRGALYFINPRYSVNRKWFASKEQTVTIGSHVFAK